MAALARHQARRCDSISDRLVVGQAELPGGRELTPEVCQGTGIAIEHLKDIALEIRRLADVHAGAAGDIGLGRPARPVDQAFEELGQYVVFVGGDHQTREGQAHALGHIAREHVAEVTRRYAHCHGIPKLQTVLTNGLEVSGKVVDDLGRDAGPVDGVDGANPVFGLEGKVR